MLQGLHVVNLEFLYRAMLISGYLDLLLACTSSTCLTCAELSKQSTTLAAAGDAYSHLASSTDITRCKEALCKRAIVLAQPIL